MALALLPSPPDPPTALLPAPIPKAIWDNPFPGPDFPITIMGDKYLYPENPNITLYLPGCGTITQASDGKRTFVSDPGCERNVPGEVNGNSLFLITGSESTQPLALSATSSDQEVINYVNKNKLKRPDDDDVPLWALIPIPDPLLIGPVATESERDDGSEAEDVFTDNEDD
ncbi:Protein of unknown function [Pyronema omphalodes CBS 100304]|uniref:Uncharacterized protein n=1 Tax=Pyronema omphalodes (strain CBS 100304) TaxID=1076935 RepID=U4KW89_PYROM|nr:Protein of unknown function [Pyronema omphalodes CBS 100304]